MNGRGKDRNLNGRERKRIDIDGLNSELTALIIKIGL